MAQVGNGAPIDAFISAADKQVDALIEKGHLDKATRRVVAGNRLVLIVPADAKSAPALFKDLADAKHRRVAVGEPKTVPAGQCATQVLEKLGVADALAGRLVYGANVRQVLDYVTRGEVAAGIVYATDAKAAGDDKVRVVATADPEMHDPIVYPAAVVTKSGKRQAAARFLDFLGGDTARQILEDRGFLVVEKPKQPPADVANDPSNDAGTDEPAQHEPASR
jgi:molybdate transport system substrate-binding protein